MSFDQRNYIDLPLWADSLRFHYWVIRVEGRNQAKRRKAYRQLKLQKIKLAESGICQQLINAVCRYLKTLTASAAARVRNLMRCEVKQLSLF